uniref:Uncharacterized protein n=1 Tax=Araucaria cunninghamii TaxID=56994 RepID=A0A0D6R4W2_ARACU
MSMALCGVTSSGVLKPSLCKLSPWTAAPSRTRAMVPVKCSLQQKSSASFVTLPRSLRYSSSLLRFEQDKYGSSERESERGRTVAAYSSHTVHLSTETLRWLFTVAAAVLMLSKNTGIHKSFLVPLLALEAPGDVITFIRGDYGLWTAFVIFLVRLFYPIPGEMELPLLFVLLVIIAPYQALNMRGTPGAMIVSIAIAAYLAYLHFTRAGGVKKAFGQGPVVATIATICLIFVPFWFLIQGYVF